MQFSDILLKWFHQHGRKDLPWQHPVSPYRVWISEIMLQQTQVITVIPYFQRFIARFPDVTALANARLDDVLHLWTGLGYYARARNLHRAAQIILQEYSGHLPDSAVDLISLPGIGRSTAGAILAISLGKPAAILDGNVKRALTRLHAIAGWPGEKAVEKQLWLLAERHTPATNFADYTQAIMDFGATVCTRSKPHCCSCPFQSECAAYSQGQPTAYPTSKSRGRLPIRQVRLLILKNVHGEILLEKRPPTGIWGGLWSLPECTMTEDIEEFCQRVYACDITHMLQKPNFRHTFSHFHLDITPIQMTATLNPSKIMDSATTVWYNRTETDARGFPAPVKQLLESLLEEPIT